MHHSPLEITKQKLVLNCRRRRNSDHAFCNIAVFNTIEGLKSCSRNLKLSVFIFELILLLLQAIDLVAVGIGLGNLREVQQSEQTRQNNQHNGIADRTERTLFRAESSRVLIPSITLPPSHGE